MREKGRRSRLDSVFRQAGTAGGGPGGMAWVAKLLGVLPRGGKFIKAACCTEQGSGEWPFTN